MPRRALSDHRPWLLAAIAAAIAYYVLEDARIGEIFIILLKGAGPIMLGVYAISRHRGPDARLLAAVMFVSGLADMALQLWFEIGAGIFIAAHLLAITLYLRNRREKRSPSQLALSAVFLILVPLIGWSLTQSPAVAFYAAVLGAMAAAGWSSRFPRYRVGVGVALFVLSDLLIFAGMSGHVGEEITSWLVWPLYFSGQFLIATGVIQTLRGAAAAES